MSFPVAALTVLGIIVAFLGLFAAGNIYVTALGLGAIAFAGVLEVARTRRS